MSVEKQEFAREVYQVHHNLKEALCRLEDLIDSDPITPRQFAKIKRILPYFRDRFIFHFQLAVEHGFFDDVLEMHPELNGPVERILEDNRRLKDELDEVCDYADRIGMDEDFTHEELRTRFKAFDRRYREHESIKIDLIQEAYTTDIGSKD